MSDSFLLSRVLLKFAPDRPFPLTDNLSAAVLTPDGLLWVASDETQHLERLSATDLLTFDQHQSFPLKDYITLPDPDTEVDIEGLDYSDFYLWIVGSHSLKRKKPKGKKLAKDLERLATISFEANRYLLARIPLIDGKLYQCHPHPQNPEKELKAAHLPYHHKGNYLTDILADDPHLKDYINHPIPSKENGFDIEGLVVAKKRIFLGLRGPVLRGWAMILELEIDQSQDGNLTLKEIGQAGKRYRKHFLDLDGMGIRELCFDQGDLIILAGPTMDLEGAMRLFRWKNVFNLQENSFNVQGEESLKVIVDLPFQFGSDHAEGLTKFSCLGQQNSLMVVYDSPNSNRKPSQDSVFADIFRF